MTRYILFFVAACALAQPVQPPAVPAALAQNWTAASHASEPFLRAHAALLLNKAEAYCLFRTSGHITGWATVAAQVAADHPDSAVAEYLYGDALARSGDATGAMARFTAAIRLDPSFAPAYNARGVLHASLNRLDQALGDFVAAQRLAPTFTDPVINRGWLTFQRQQNGQVALDLFQKALAMSPDSMQARVGKAFALTILGRDEDARAAIGVLASNASGCMAVDLAQDLLALAGWTAQRGASEYARNESVGTAVTRDLNRVLHGDVSVIPRLASAAAANPAQATRINTYFSHLAQTNPALGQRIATSINSGARNTSPQGLPQYLIAAASGITLRAGSSNAGISYSPVQLGQHIATNLLTQNRGYQALQSGFKPAHQQIGGVDTAFAQVAFDRGDYPVLACYVLAYPRIVKEAK